MITLNSRAKINKKIVLVVELDLKKVKLLEEVLKVKIKIRSSNKSFGGQMPLYRRLPKRGFNPILRENIAIWT